MDKDLNNALKNLKKDGIKLKFIETLKGDNYFIIDSKHWKTEIGANDLGFWFKGQVPKKKK